MLNTVTLSSPTTSLPPASIGFIGFWPRWNPVWNDFTVSLADKIPLTISLPEPSGHLQQIPRHLFYSVFGKNYKDTRYSGCTKIFTSQENFGPPWDECHYAMTGDYLDDPRHLRFPCYVQHVLRIRDQPGYQKLKHPCPTLIKDPATDWSSVLAYKTMFCSFVCSNDRWRDPRSRGVCGLAERIQFFDLLSKYKPINSGGRIRNNIGSRIEEKLPFIEPHKFTIAFENASYPGYVSEKIVDAMVSLSIPIYWGSPEIDDDFDTQSIIVATGRRPTDVIDEVIALDRDDSAYLAKLRRPWFKDNVPNRYCTREYLDGFLLHVFREKQ